MEPQRCPGPNLRICEASRMWQGALQMGSEGEQEMVTLSCRVLQCIKYTIVEFTPPPFSFILPSPFVSVENQCITGFIKDGRGERRVWEKLEGVTQLALKVEEGARNQEMWQPLQKLERVGQENLPVPPEGAQLSQYLVFIPVRLISEPGVVAHTCKFQHTGGWAGGSWVPGQPEQDTEILLQKANNKKDSFQTSNLRNCKITALNYF
jgi:hypothetical protein